MYHLLTPSVTMEVYRVLPGLLHFSAEPLVLRPKGAIRWLRVALPGFQTLTLSRLELWGASKDRLSTAKVTTGPTGVVVETFRNGSPIKIGPAIGPSLLIQFSPEIQFEELRLFNRIDRLATATLDLECTWEDGDGRLWSYHHADIQNLQLRLGAHLSAQESFVRHLRELSKPVRAPLQKAISEVNDGLARVAASAQSRMAGVTAGDDDGTLRLEALGRVSSILKHLTGKDLLRLLPVAARLADGLIDRGARSRDEKVDAAELDGLAMVLAAPFVKQGHVDRATINENDALLRNRQNVAHVEEEIDRIYVAASGDGSISPIMFRSHGIGGVTLLKEPMVFVEAMLEIHAVFERIGLESAICYGTLLGAVREGSFIPHDDDVDMIVRLEIPEVASLPSALNALAERLRQLGLRTLIRKQNFLKVWSPSANKEVDVFPVVDTGTKTFMHMESLTIREVPRQYVLPFGELKFYGALFKVPAEPSEFLKDRYGPDWMTPIRQAAVKMTIA